MARSNHFKIRSPFSFEPTTDYKPIEEAIMYDAVGDSCDTPDQCNYAFNMESEDIHPTESLEFQVYEKVGATNQKKPLFQAQNIPETKMEISSDDESVFDITQTVRGKLFDNVSGPSAKKVLHYLKLKIASQARKKHPASSLEQNFLKQVGGSSKNESLDSHKKSDATNSLMASISHVPKLQDLHAAQLQHGTDYHITLLKGINLIHFK
jgi:hypothetical protein